MIQTSKRIEKQRDQLSTAEKMEWDEVGRGKRETNKVGKLAAILTTKKVYLRI